MTDEERTTPPAMRSSCPSVGSGPGATLVLLRHGETEWNRAGRLTGWVDVPLSGTGRAQAEAAGRALAVAGLRPDLVLCSTLGRARDTARIAMHAGGFDLGVGKRRLDWRLNERHYGVLEGHTRDSAAAAFGAGQARSWRREVDARPPGADNSGQAAPHLGSVGLDPAGPGRPLAESLQDVETRVLACWHETLSSMLGGRTVLIVSHTNPIRALSGHLQGLAMDQIWACPVPSATPITLRLGASSCRAVGEQEVLHPAGPRPSASE